MKLHLGCGDKHIDGYINIDCRFLPTVDEVQDVTILRKYKNNSINVIYASHVLEHFKRWDYKYVLNRWYELLGEGGILRIAVPDFEQIVNHYVKHKNLRELSGLLYGGQDYEKNFHHWIWDFQTLKEDLIDVGFHSVYRYDWRKTEHNQIDDFSQSYLPHLCKDNGMLMSLNVEAIK
jgi:predicted SAM-dependent methyltransferase